MLNFEKVFDFEVRVRYTRLVTKKCPRCSRRLPVADFNWKIKSVRRATYCKKCSREYIRDHYKKNREYYLLKARKRNSEIRQKAGKYIWSYLSAHPCVDCGETDILVLEFDHRDKSRKSKAVSRIIRTTGSLEQLIEEISKCDVRCANCHRRKTEKENNSWKLSYAPVA